MKRGAEPVVPVVIDTNAYLSALISPAGTVAQAVDSAILHGRPIASDETLAELAEKLNSKKLAKFISPESRARMLSLVTEMSERVAAPHVYDACRDPKDNKFLDLALAGGAHTIVSGDKDLLDLGSVPGSGAPIAIVTPRQYLDAHPLPAAPQRVFHAPKPAVAPG